MPLEVKTVCACLVFANVQPHTNFEAYTKKPLTVLSSKYIIPWVYNVTGGSNSQCMLFFACLLVCMHINFLKNRPT